MSIFKNYTELTPIEYKAFTRAYLKISNRNRITTDKNGDAWGFVKGMTEAEWRWNNDEWRLYTDKSDTEVWKLVRSGS